MIPKTKKNNTHNIIKLQPIILFIFIEFIKIFLSQILIIYSIMYNIFFVRNINQSIIFKQVTNN